MIKQKNNVSEEKREKKTKRGRERRREIHIERCIEKDTKGQGWIEKKIKIESLSEESFYYMLFLPISISKPVWTRYLRFLKCLERKCCPKSFVSGDVRCMIID